MDITDFSDKQSAGQRLMVGFDGIELNDELEFLINDAEGGRHHPLFQKPHRPGTNQRSLLFHAIVCPVLRTAAALDRHRPGGGPGGPAQRTVYTVPGQSKDERA